jgi:fumarate hydratase subunit beta
MDQTIRLETPLTLKDLEQLRIGDRVLLNGFVYTARDAAHHRLIELINNDKPLPMELNGHVIYYVGPTPAKPGMVIGAAGPTSSYRMDDYTPALLEKGLKGMIGKGARNEAVKEAMKKHKAVYFAAIGGAGALIAQSIRSAKIVAYPDLETEAIRRLEIQDFPAIVAIDIYGGDLYESGQSQFSL